MSLGHDATYWSFSTANVKRISCKHQLKGWIIEANLSDILSVNCRFTCVDIFSAKKYVNTEDHFIATLRFDFNMFAYIIRSLKCLVRLRLD